MKTTNIHEYLLINEAKAWFIQVVFYAVRPRNRAYATAPGNRMRQT